MENKFEKDNGNMNNENKADKIANFLYNMNCGLTRKEKKLKKEKISQTRIEVGKKQIATLTSTEPNLVKLLTRIFRQLF